MTIDAAILPLARAIRAMGTQFSLHLVRCPRSARTALTAALLRLRAEPGVPLFVFANPAYSGASFIDDLLNGGMLVDGVVLIDGDSLLDHDASSLRALNLARDRLPSLCHGPLVIVLTEDALDDLALHAPDLFSVRSTVTNFGREQAVLIEAAPTGAAVSVVEELRAQLDQLSIRGDNTTPELVADLLLVIAVSAHNALRNAPKSDQQDLMGIEGDALARCIEVASSVGYERAVIDAKVLRVGMAPSSSISSDEVLLRESIVRLRELGAAQSEANAWIALGSLLRSESPAVSYDAIVNHAIPLLATAGAMGELRNIVVEVAERVRLNEGSAKALEIVDSVWERYEELLPTSDRSALLWLRSSLSQFVGKLDRAIEHAQAAREAAVATRNAELTRAALLREIVARAARRANVDRAVVAQLLPQFRRFARPPANVAAEDASLDAALVRLGLREESLSVPGRGPRNRAERRRRRR